MHLVDMLLQLLNLFGLYSLHVACELLQSTTSGITADFFFPSSRKLPVTYTCIAAGVTATCSLHVHAQCSSTCNYLAELEAIVKGVT